MPTCKNCGFVFPNFVFLEGRKRNLSSRKFCITCSPFGKRDNNRGTPNPALSHRQCASCGVCKSPEDFHRPYGKRSRIQSYCKVCQQKMQNARLKSFKQKCVEYLGSCCMHCGYSKCIAAMEFHHKNPTEKEFGIAKVRNRAFSQVIKDELDKCELLCSNCHKEVHYNISSL